MYVRISKELVRNSGTAHIVNGERTMIYDTEYYNKDGELVPNGQVAIKDSAVGKGLHRKDFMQSIKGRRDSDLRAELKKVGFDFGELGDYHRVGKVNFEHTAADPNDNRHPDNSHIYFNTPKPNKNEFFGNLTGSDVYVERDNRKEGNMFDMYDVAQLRMKREDPNIGIVANPNQLTDGAVAWKGDVSYADRRGDIGDLGDYVNTDHHDDADVPYDNEYFRTGFPMNIAFQLLKAQQTLHSYDPDSVEELLHPNKRTVFISSKPNWVNEENPMSEKKQSELHDNLLAELGALENKKGMKIISARGKSVEWGDEHSIALSNVPDHHFDNIMGLASKYEQDSVLHSPKGTSSGELLKPSGEVDFPLGEGGFVDDAENMTEFNTGQRFAYGKPMGIAFQLLKGKSYIQDRPKRLAQAKVQRLSRKVKNARTQHKYKRNLARGAIRPKMRTQTGLVRVARSR